MWASDTTVAVTVVPMFAPMIIGTALASGSGNSGDTGDVLAGALALVALGLNLIYGTIITIMTWRLSLGGIDLYRDDQMTMVLEIPRWWTFPAALACLVLLLAVCIYTTVRSVSEIRLNRPL